MADKYCGFPLTTYGNDITLSSAFACATADKCRQRLTNHATSCGGKMRGEYQATSFFATSTAEAASGA